jgi:hypothetical protein
MQKTCRRTASAISGGRGRHGCTATCALCTRTPPAQLRVGGGELHCCVAGSARNLTRTAAKGLDNYHAREHLHLRSADAKTIMVSYFHAAEPESPDNRAVKLVRIELQR